MVHSVNTTAIPQLLVVWIITIRQVITDRLVGWLEDRYPSLITGT